MNKFVRNYWNQLSTKQQAMFFVIQGSVIGGVIGIAININMALHHKYSPLYSHMTKEDMFTVAKSLEIRKIPFRIDYSNRSIEIPADHVKEQRIIFENGFSELKTDINNKQLLNNIEGTRSELQRVICSLRGIENARVFLDIPESLPSQGIPQDRKAHVTLRLREGYHLSQAELRGIIQLVSASVDHLRPENVIVFDSRGNELRLTTSQTQDES